MDSTTFRRCSIFINRFWELNCDYMSQILHIVNNSQHSDMISCQSSHTEVWKMYHDTSFTCSPSLSLSVYFFFLGDISPALCSLLSHCSRTQHRDPSVARSRPLWNVANTELPSHSEPDDQKQTTKTNTAFACERIPSVAADVALKSLQSSLSLSLSALSLSVFLSLAVSRHPWQMWSRKRSPTSAARWEMQLDHTTRQEATEQRRWKVDLGRLRFNFSNRLLILGLVIVETSRRKINRESLKLTIPSPPSIRPFPHK